MSKLLLLLETCTVGGAVALSLLATAARAQPPTNNARHWQGCCALQPWPEAGPMTNRRGSTGGILFGGYASVVPGSTVRHRIGLNGGIPAAYANARNPLPPTLQNAQRGAAVYDAHCASCHGATGLGDGPASRTLIPPPAQLGWLLKLRPSRWDPFMYWTVVEGGQPLGTAMPSYKGKLADEQIWSAIGYIQARLPKATAAVR